MVYPHPDWDPAAPDPRLLPEMTGKAGLRRVLDYVDDKETPLGNIRYRDGGEDCFSPENIGKYSAKIATVLAEVRRSTGIVFVYSTNIEDGLLPMALALEQMGLERVVGTADGGAERRNLWASEELPPPPQQQKQRYIMITGQTNLQPNLNSLSLALATARSNREGAQVKVVLVSAAGAESLDFKCLRQVHLFDPWFNRSRPEQVVGRGVRTRSHCALPFDQRNVQIYYHVVAAAAAEEGEEVETVDMFLYRYSEEKELTMAPVRRVLKEASVDCLLNAAQQNFTVAKMDQTITLSLSNGGGQVQFDVGDRPFSHRCDFFEDCAFRCAPQVAGVQAAKVLADAIISDSYTAQALRANEARLVRRLRELYRERSYYTFDELRARVTQQQSYPAVQIFQAVQKLIDDPALWVVNGAGTRGRIVALRGSDGSDDSDSDSGDSGDSDIDSGDSDDEGARKRKKKKSGSGSRRKRRRRKAATWWYVFSPAHVTDRAATVFERSAPAPQQPASVLFQGYQLVGASEARVAAVDAARLEIGEDAAAHIEEAHREEARARARLIVPVLAVLLRRVLADQDGEEDDGEDEEDEDDGEDKDGDEELEQAARAAADTVDASDRKWYTSLGVALPVMLAAQVQLTLPGRRLARAEVAWAAAQHFLDSRRAEDRAQLAALLLLSTPSPPAVDRAAPIDDAALGTPRAARRAAAFFARRYVAERVFRKPGAAAAAAAAFGVFADQLAAPPRMLRVSLATMEEQVGAASDWLRSAEAERWGRAETGYLPTDAAHTAVIVPSVPDPKLVASADEPWTVVASTDRAFTFSAKRKDTRGGQLIESTPHKIWEAICAASAAHNAGGVAIHPDAAALIGPSKRNDAGSTRADARGLNLKVSVLAVCARVARLRGATFTAISGEEYLTR